MRAPGKMGSRARLVKAVRDAAPESAERYQALAALEAYDPPRRAMVIASYGDLI